MPDMPEPLSGRPLPSSFDENDDFYNESGFSKVMRRVKQEPLIPLGCLLTVAAFTNAYRAMRRGDHNQVQRMFRARILAQGFTVAAMVAGGLYFGAERQKERELWKLQEVQTAEEKRQKWIKELEARDDEEKALREKMDRRRKKVFERAARDSFREAGETAEEAKTADSQRADPEPGALHSTRATEHTANTEKQHAHGLFGGWFGGSSKHIEGNQASDPTKK